jgi:hypothetical protein
LTSIFSDTEGVDFSQQDGYSGVAAGGNKPTDERGEDIGGGGERVTGRRGHLELQRTQQPAKNQVPKSRWRPAPPASMRKPRRPDEWAVERERMMSATRARNWREADIVCLCVYGVVKSGLETTESRSEGPRKVLYTPAGWQCWLL